MQQGKDTNRTKYYKRFTFVMLTFIYPRNDWTAVEVVLKIQALASSQNYKVYATPKNTRRDEEMIKRKLLKTRYAIFVAIDSTEPDEDTIRELRFLKERNVRIYGIVQSSFRRDLVADFLDKKYVVNKRDPKGFIEAFSNILTEIKSTAEKQGGEVAGLIAFLGIIGILLLFISLLFGKKDVL